jgi:hypothetical protein
LVFILRLACAGMEFLHSPHLYGLQSSAVGSCSIMGLVSCNIELFILCNIVLLASCTIVLQGDEAELRQRLIMDDNEAFMAGGGADEAGDDDWGYDEGDGEQAAAAGQSIEPQDLAMDEVIDDDELQYDGIDQQYDEQYNVTEQQQQQQQDDGAGGSGGQQQQPMQGAGEEEFLDYGGEDQYENGDDEERLMDDDQDGEDGGYAGGEYGEGLEDQGDQYAAEGDYEGLDEDRSDQQQQQQQMNGSGPVIGDLGSEEEGLGTLLEDVEDEQPAPKPAQQQKQKQPMPAPAHKQAAPQGQQQPGQQQPGQQQKPAGGPPKVRQRGQGVGV